MENISLNKALRNMYDNEVSFIKEKNRELEREYFSTPGNTPFEEIMQGASYEDHFTSYKKGIKNATDDEIDGIFMLLREYFLFSYGHDMMYKKKLKADLFTSAPIEDLLYPRLQDAVNEKYNDISVMRENPNFEKNIQGIGKIIATYMDIQSTLYLLYYSDFQFPNGWEGLCDVDAKDVIDELNKLNMTIGDFLHALIDEKCNTIKEIFNEIQNPALRKKYLEKLEALREEKHKETSGFAHVSLPVTFFLDHTIADFIKMESKSSLFADEKPKVSQKLYIPNN